MTFFSFFGIEPPFLGSIYTKWKYQGESSLPSFVWVTMIRGLSVGRSPKGSLFLFCCYISKWWFLKYHLFLPWTHCGKRSNMTKIFSNRWWRKLPPGDSIRDLLIPKRWRITKNQPLSSRLPVFTIPKKVTFAEFSVYNCRFLFVSWLDNQPPPNIPPRIAGLIKGNQSFS